MGLRGERIFVDLPDDRRKSGCIFVGRGLWRSSLRRSVTLCRVSLLNVCIFFDWANCSYVVEGAFLETKPKCLTAIWYLMEGLENIFGLNGVVIGYGDGAPSTGSTLC